MLIVILQVFLILIDFCKHSPAIKRGQCRNYSTLYKTINLRQYNFYQIFFCKVQITMSTTSLPQYCTQCSWLFSKMGACRPPDISLFFSLISFVPYVLIFLFIGLSIFMRGSRQIKLTILMISAYIIADRIVKNIIAMPRPTGACKTTYGFPSSHMVALCTYLFEMFPYCNRSQKFFFLFLIISQSMARVQLKYHTWIQVVGGIVFALVYTYIFNVFYQKFQQHPKVKQIYTLLGVQEYHPKKGDKIKKIVKSQ